MIVLNGFDVVLKRGKYEKGDSVKKKVSVEMKMVEIFLR